MPLAYSSARDELISTVHDALYCTKICVYAQGFQLMRQAQHVYDWELDMATIARIWRGGCQPRGTFFHLDWSAAERRQIVMDRPLEHVSQANGRADGSPGLPTMLPGIDRR